jgi:hypothetical protein
MNSGIAERLTGVWGVPGDTVYAVGDWGRIVRYDGSSWEDMSLSINNSFNAVWGTAHDDVFAIGTGRIIVHWDGTEWTTQDSFSGQTLNDIHGNASDYVFVVGNGYIAQFYNGEHWIKIYIPEWALNFNVDINSCWVAPDGELWVVGTDGDVARYGFDDTAP